jgi:hypothetical protein
MTIAEYLTYWLTNVAQGKVRRTTYVNYEGQEAAGTQASLLRPRESAARSSPLTGPCASCW